MNYFKSNLAQELYQKLKQDLYNYIKLLPMLMNGKVRVGEVVDKLSMVAQEAKNYNS